jgi:hypothetical protein
VNQERLDTSCQRIAAIHCLRSAVPGKVTDKNTGFCGVSRSVLEWLDYSAAAVDSPERHMCERGSNRQIFMTMPLKHERSELSPHISSLDASHEVNRTKEVRGLSVGNLDLVSGCMCL